MNEKIPVLIFFVGLALASLGVVAGENRVVFLTSTTGSPDLASWDDSGEATGLAAGDAICQSRAEAASLDNPGNFVAWLSGSSDDAYCRIHGLAGKKADNCGQAVLPESAGPWVRADGYPFAPEVSRLLAPENAVYMPPWRDEFGEPVEGFRSVLTGTDAEGVAADIGRTCEDWTSTEASPGPIVGSAGTTSLRWTSAGGVACNHTYLSLMCMEQLPGTPLPSFEQSGQLAFVTSAFGSGDLSSWPQAGAGASGVDAGDSICRNLAADAGLPYPDGFKALLSDNTTDAIDRFDTDGPWIRPDGVMVAANKAELFGETLSTAITVTESGDYLPSSDFYHAWTGTNPDGSASGWHCGNWELGSAETQGRSGNSAAANSFWTGGNPGNWPDDCDSSYALYCLSDSTMEIFADRFETQ